MDKQNMIQCPTCKTWNNRNAEFCVNCGSRLTAFAGEWWKDYNMEPREFSNVSRGYVIAYILSFIMALYAIFLGYVAYNDMESKSALILTAIGSLVLLAISAVIFLSGRKQEKEFRTIDFVEVIKMKKRLFWEVPEKSKKYVFVMSGTYTSHRFGLYNGSNIVVPLIYETLKWQEEGKLLFAVKNGVPMIIDLKGKRYE